MKIFLEDPYVMAFFWGYIAFGLVSYILTDIIMACVWEKTTCSYKEMYKSSPPPELDNEKRKPFNWAPRLIGILERIFYTSAVAFGQFVLIGVWIAFKIIGEWGDLSFINNKHTVKKSKPDESMGGTTRIRANNFLIGSAFSLLFGILGGVLFRLTLSNNFLVELIQKSYTSIK